MSRKTKTTATTEEATPALVPKLRFPEFRDAEGWAQNRLIDTADRAVKWSFIGGPFGSNLKSSDYVPNGIRIIQLQNIGDGEFFDDYRIYTSAEKADELLSNNIYPGEIIMSKMGDPVGRACLIPEWHDRYVMCSDGIRLVVDEKKNDKYFIYSLINAPLFRDVVEKTATGSTRKRIGLDDLKSLPMWLPKKPEQQKIAECLSSVDELMAAQARKVDALKTHKKGLMQQLFPREGETQPRLRFPEFQNAGEWEEKKLGSVCDIQRGKFSHRPRNDPRFFGGPYPFIQTGDVVKSEGGAVVASQSLNEEGLAVSKLFKPTIVLITIAANIGDTGLLQTAGCFTDSVVGLIPKNDVIPVFLELIMRGQKENLNKVATTGAQKNINNEILREVSVLLPSVPEQQRIATCLSSLDALITAETQKHEALKTHKKGLMQQLFPSPEEVAG